MANDPQRQIRENTMELHDFLKDLKGWEQTVKEKERTLKSQVSAEEAATFQKISKPRRHAPVNVNSPDSKQVKLNENETITQTKRSTATYVSSKSAAAHTHEYFRDKWDTFDVEAALREIDNEEEEEEQGNKKEVEEQPGKEVPEGRAVESKPKSKTLVVSANGRSSVTRPSNAGVARGHLKANPMAGRLSDALGLEDTPPDANTEKELGNEYFKEAKYVTAIDCYSRSIALQPTAVAFANRAMAELKIRRYEAAEQDCSEAISLDDRYVKAYSRRGTARKELKKYLLAVEDFEFALRLEPENKELKRQYVEGKELYEKEAKVRPSEGKVSLVIEELNDKSSQKVQKIDADVAQRRTSKKESTSGGFITLSDSAPIIQSVSLSELKPKPKQMEQVMAKGKRVSEGAVSTQGAAARAAAAAMATVSQNVVAPRTSYEFETFWKGFSGDRASQARILKVMDPSSLPKVFKDSLGAPLLVEIIQTLELIFPDDPERAVEILDNLKKVGRFNMTILFFSPKDKSGLSELWENVFLASNVSESLRCKLQLLRSVYRLK